MQNIEFRHTLPIQLRFSDVDKFGHVNNTVYFTYYDLGKVQYFTTAHPSLDWNRYGVVIAHIDVDFITPIFSTDDIAVQTTVTEIGTKSMTLMQQVIDIKTHEAKCICRTILVAFDIEKHSAIEIPEEWKEAICAFEHKDVRKKKVSV